MRILLDECLPAELADELTGHEVRTAQQEGWSSLENGELLRRAAVRFAVFITVDKHIERTRKLPGTLSVITIRARTNRIQSLRPLVPDILQVIGTVRPGTFVRVGGTCQLRRAAVGGAGGGACSNVGVAPPRLTPGVGRRSSRARFGRCNISG